MEPVIERNSIPNLLESLSRDYRIVAPQERNGEIVFDNLGDHESMLLKDRDNPHIISPSSASRLSLASMLSLALLPTFQQIPRFPKACL